MNEAFSAEHLSEAALLRFLDREMETPARRRLRAHLRGCGGCRQRARQLRSTARELDVLLPLLDPPSPASLIPPTFQQVQSRRRRFGRPRPTASAAPWRRAAAVAALALLAGLAVSPLSARALDWLGARWSGWAERVGLAEDSPQPPQPPQPPQAPQPATPAADVAPAELRFVPEGSELRLQFTHAQADGSLLVRTSTDPAALLEIAGSRQGIQVLLLPDEIRVQNAVATAATYALTLPPGVDALQVRIGGKPPVLVRAGDGERRIPLH